MIKQECIGIPDMILINERLKLLSQVPLSVPKMLSILKTQAAS